MVIWRESKPDLLYAYLSSPQDLSTLDEVHKDFAIGSYARFSGSALHELFIVDRPEFYNMSHQQIPRMLDDEGSTDPYLVIDDKAAESHSVWYVVSTETSEVSADDLEVIRYHGENLILKLRMKTREIHGLHLNFEIANMDITECLCDGHIPYDPHSDQEPYDLGIDHETDHFAPDAYLTASNDEVEFSTDPEFCQIFLPRPQEVVRIKPEIAEREGLISRWWFPRKIPEGWAMQCKYNWNHEKWKGPYQPLQHRMDSEDQIGKGTMYKHDTGVVVD